MASTKHYASHKQQNRYLATYPAPRSLSAPTKPRLQDSIPILGRRAWERGHTLTQAT